MACQKVCKQGRDDSTKAEFYIYGIAPSLNLFYTTVRQCMGIFHVPQQLLTFLEVHAIILHGTTHTMEILNWSELQTGHTVSAVVIKKLK